MTGLIAADAYVFTNGYDSVLWQHDTKAEKELQRLKIEKLHRENG
jgi:hypothetical protein